MLSPLAATRNAWRGDGRARGLAGWRRLARRPARCQPRHPAATRHGRRAAAGHRRLPVASPAPTPIRRARPTPSVCGAARPACIAGDCAVLPSSRGRRAVRGRARPLNTPFGVIYTPTSRRTARHGIGTVDARSVLSRDARRHRRRTGQNLIRRFRTPGSPRTAAPTTTRSSPILKTVPAVRYTPPPNELPFPFNIRFLVKGWNLLFFSAATPSQPGPDAERRVEPRRLSRRRPRPLRRLPHAEELARRRQVGPALHGGALENWVAPDLTGNPHTGLGAWSVDDIAEFLTTGRNAHAGAGGTMAEVVSYSTSLMSRAGPQAPSPSI